MLFPVVAPFNPSNILNPNFFNFPNIIPGITVKNPIIPITNITTNITINIIGNAGAAAATTVLAPLAAVVSPAAAAVAPAVPAPALPAPATPAPPAPAPPAPKLPVPPPTPVPPAPPVNPFPFGSPLGLFPALWFAEFAGVEVFPDSLPLPVLFASLFFVLDSGSDLLFSDLLLEDSSSDSD